VLGTEERRRQREAHESAELKSSSLLLREVGAKRGQVAVPRQKLAAAATAWMMLVFGICYVAIPVSYQVVGLRESQLGFLPADLRALGLVWALVMGFIALARPQVRLDRRIDPVLPAMVGGLAAWGLLHNVLPFLTPFVAMPLPFLVAFVLANVLENGLFGAMLASLVRTRLAAFLLGALFQTVFMSTAYYFLLTL
jgi:hypothetical protein